MANFTKQAIKLSFIKLLNERPLNKISVRDIVEDCGINRNSFYYHFQDISALLEEIVTEETEKLIREYPTISSLDECFLTVFRFARENRRATLHIYYSVNREMFTREALKRCEYAVSVYIATAYPNERLSESDRQVVIRFLKCQLFGMCIDWMERGMSGGAYDELHRMLELVRLLGVLMIVFGVIKLVGYFSRDLFRLAFEYDLAFGLLLVVLGIVMLSRPGGTLNFLAMMCGIPFLTDGFFKIQLALDARRFGILRWWLIIALAALTCCAGTVLLCSPAAGVRIVTALLGAALLADGALNLSVALCTVKIVAHQRPDDLDDPADE